ncbi:MAG: hypothetical protein ACRYFX_29290 [Janthinobacterium lividum]
MQLHLQHVRQPFPWGCQYYSLYALVGDCRILDDVTECQSTRFEERARELGYFLYRVYADVTCTVPMSAALWEKLFGCAEGIARVLGYDVPFLIDTNSLKHKGVYHTVGIVLTGRHGYTRDCNGEDFISVRVFDPGAAGEKEYATLADFLASPYGQVYELKQVMPLDAFDDLFPKHFGPDAAHVSPEVRRCWEIAQTQKQAA